MKKRFSFPVLCAVLVAAALVFVVSVRSCSTQHSAAEPDSPPAASPQAAAAPGDTQAQQGWPRTLQTPKGPLTLQQPPERIVSTSVTITGTLLAIHAPLVGSGATSRNSIVSDGRGFLSSGAPRQKRSGCSPYIFLSQTPRRLPLRHLT